MAMLLVMFTVADPLQARRAIVVLVVVAIAGFVAAYTTWQRIRADLEALAVVSRPADMIGTASETVESF